MNYNMNIDIHVVDGDGLNTNTLQQNIWSLFVNWRDGSLRRKKQKWTIKYDIFFTTKINKKIKRPDSMQYS